MGGACVLVYCPKKILVSRAWPVLWLSVGSGGPSPGGLGRSHRGGRSLSHLALDLRRSAVSGFPLSILSFDVGNKMPGRILCSLLPYLCLLVNCFLLSVEWNNFVHNPLNSAFY